MSAVPDSMPPGLSVAMAAPEMTPLAKTGGLGDVLGALPRALRNRGIDVSVILPGYRTALEKLAGDECEVCGQIEVPLGGRREEATLLLTHVDGVPVYLVQADRYYDRPQLYSSPDGDYSDNAERFAFFARAVLEVLRMQPHHLLHCHDWQAAPAIAFLRGQSHSYTDLVNTKTVITIHNLGYQGVFSVSSWPLLGLDDALFHYRYLEFYNQVNYLKAGLVFADAITTVSPTYAAEIRNPESGFGLDGVLRERQDCLRGILNGVDYDIWDPQSDRLIAAQFSPPDMTGKRDCKAWLQRHLGLPLDPDVPLIGMVSRLAVEKGFDLLGWAGDALLARNVQLAVLATGGRELQAMLNRLSSMYPARLGVRFAFDDVLAHGIIAGSDMFLMPSRYEPGGLAQLYAMRYGTVPIVRATGGLKDTVVEFSDRQAAGNGFLFGPYTPEELLSAIDRSLHWYRTDRWQEVMANAMAADFSWERSSTAYLELYRRLVDLPLI